MTTLHQIRILPSDSPRAVLRITWPHATRTDWWYVLPGEARPRPIRRIGKHWKCIIPSVSGLELNADEDFHTIIEDLRLSGATIYNKLRR